MKIRSAAPLLVCLTVCAALGFWRPAPAPEMTTAAKAFVQSLRDDQRSQTLLPYETPLRTDWHFIPKPARKGLQVRDMSEAQRKAAFDLLRSTLSAAGYGKATKIMQLESILRELEKARVNGMVRDPERYFFTLFGQPDAEVRWGLSIEGHHLSLNFVVEGNRVISSTPTFFGANPGVLLADYGPEFKKGLRVLAKEEELAFQLLASLTTEQRSTAIVAAKAPSDIRAAGSASPPLFPAVGLAAAQMTSEQTALLRTLIEEYARNMPAEVAQDRLDAIQEAGFEKIHFAWSGADKPGAGHDYHIQGPTFLIEFNNTQPDSAGNLANHVHSIWHQLSGNFALPATADNAEKQ